jgi:RNA polymerase sigma-70 factor (ECF subfamily)
MEGNAAISHNDRFMRAYDEYGDALFRHCYFRVYDREKAKDLMQECFTRTWECIVKGQDIKNVRAFLYRVANNLIIDNSRKKTAASLDDLMDQGIEPEPVHDKRPLVAAEFAGVAAALDKVDERYRDVIVMRYIDGLTPGEIAEVLGETENAVSVRLHRGIAAVRKIINV